MTEPPEAVDPAIRILIVDDHAIVRQGVRTFLDTQPDLTVVGAAASCCVQQKLDLHRIERELDAAFFRPVEDPCFEQCRDVPMDRLDVTPDAPRGFADGDRPGATKRLEMLPAPSSQRSTHWPPPT